MKLLGKQPGLNASAGIWSEACSCAALWEPSAKVSPCRQGPEIGAVSSEGWQTATYNSPSYLCSFSPSVFYTFLSPAFFRSVFLSLLSESECLHFLQQTASRGTRVYFATCGDGSLPRQELAASRCWFLTCVHPFTSMAVRSALLSHPPRPSRFFLPFKGHVEPFDMRFIGLRGAVGALFETVKKCSKY